MKARQIFGFSVQGITLFIFIYLLIFPKYAAEPTRTALGFCATALIPGLFIYMVLAKLIAGIYLPTSGQILFNGTDITNATITERAKLGITYAFQQPVRFKGITVKDLITLASGKELTISEVCNYLSEVGLCARDYIDREINNSLSGGELKRIEIAMILARGTKMSIFDDKTEKSIFRQLQSERFQLCLPGVYSSIATAISASEEDSPENSVTLAEMASMTSFASSPPEEEITSSRRSVPYFSPLAFCVSIISLE